MKNVENFKKTESYVKCKIDYVDYEASFNMPQWELASTEAESKRRKEMLEFVNIRTIDCEP